MSKLRQMEVFVAVVEAGSFAEAAVQVGMSAVMVGRHIQSLETALNTKLIQRTTWHFRDCAVTGAANHRIMRHLFRRPVSSMMRYGPTRYAACLAALA